METLEESTNDDVSRVINQLKFIGLAWLSQKFDSTPSLMQYFFYIEKWQNFAEE